MSFVLYLHFSSSWNCAISANFQFFVNLKYYVLRFVFKNFYTKWWAPCILASYFWLSLFLRHTVDTVWRALCCEELMSKMLCDSFLVASLEPEGSKNQAYSHCFMNTSGRIVFLFLFITVSFNYYNNVNNDYKPLLNTNIT